MLQKDHISKAICIECLKKKRNIVVCLLDFMKLKICFDTIVKQTKKKHYLEGQQKYMYLKENIPLPSL